MSSPFAAVDTLPKQQKSELNPRQTRYGFLPIWSKATSSRDFAVWTMPANQVFPFRPFVGEIGQDVNGRETYRVERLPADQIIDMQVTSPYFTELTALAKLNDEDKARRISEVLASDKECVKYSVEIGNACATCWIDYLRNDVRAKIKTVFKEEADCQRAANRSVEELMAALEKALGEARRQLDQAIRDIDDPAKGKSVFYEYDYLNVYHTHADRPTYRTSTNNANIGEQIAQALKSAMAPAAPAIDANAIAAIVAEAVAKETSALRAELDAYRTVPEDTVLQEDVEELIEQKAADVVEKIKKAKEDK